ncbi:MAG: hypothetical protein ACTHMI_15110 [Mucilaginibacter sp.]
MEQITYKNNLRKLRLEKKPHTARCRAAARAQVPGPHLAVGAGLGGAAHKKFDEIKQGVRGANTRYLSVILNET